MSKESIAEEIKNFILAQFLPDSDPKEITLDFPLISHGIIDSVSMLMLINYLEDEYNISFELHEIERDGFNTINQMADRVAEKHKSGS